MIRPTPLLKLTLLGFLTISLHLFAVSTGYGKSPYDNFFSDLESDDDPPVKARNPLKDLKKNTDAGTTIGCKNCSSGMTPATKVIKSSEEIAEATKKTVKPKREKRVLTDFVDTPASTGPTPESELWSKFPDIAAYSDSKDVATAIRIAKSKAHRASLGMCYAYVKDAIYNSQVKLTSHRLVGNRVFPDRRIRRGDFGQTAIKNFEDEGFDNLLENPETKHLITNAASAPKGAIMIYRGGTRGGHIEIKTDYGAKADYVSDFKSNNSALYNELQGRRSPSGRMELVGVMVKRAK